jgi:hypothetical protein
MARLQLSAPGRPSPTPKSSRDYVSALSTPSYATSISSSTFTLSSNSSLFGGRPNQDRPENALSCCTEKSKHP